VEVEMRPSLVKKQDQVKVVSDKMKNSAATIVINYSGLTVSEITDLRVQLKELNGEMLQQLLRMKKMQFQHLNL
jgi:ribosomal protein L10